MTFLRRVYSMHPLAMLAGLSLAALTIPSYRWLDAERAQVGAIPREIHRQGEETRAALLIAIGDARKDVMAAVSVESDAWRKMIDEDLGGLALVADRRLAHLEVTADARLASIQSDLNTHGLIVEQLAARELGRAVDGWVGVAKPVGAVAAQVADAAPLYLDCDHNADCAFNRFQGTSKAVEKASQTVAVNLPEFVGELHKFNENGIAISGDVRRSVDWVTRPRKHWYQRILCPWCPGK